MDVLELLFFGDDGAYENERNRKRRRAFFVAYMLYCRGFKFTLDEEGNRQRDRRIPLASLVDPAQSAWMALYQSKNDQAMITVTGLDSDTFASILENFKVMFYDYTPWTSKNDGTTMALLRNPSAGRKRKITDHALLGLFLSYYRFRGPFYILQGWFGFTGTHLSVWLRFGHCILLHLLRKSHEASVRLPSDNEIEDLKQSVCERHPQLNDVYSVCDGVKVRFQSCEGMLEQGVFYNGWTHGHYVSNLFVFAADGRIIMCIINAPGSVHDSQLADWGDVYSQLQTVYQRTGGICCVDSAFASNDDPYLNCSSEDLTKAKDALDRMRLLQATSLRQAAEWGMNAIESAFPRLLDTIRYEEQGERAVILRIVPLLYNYRLEKVGLNQIRNVYNPSLSVDSRFYLGWN